MFTNYFIKRKIQALATRVSGRPHRSVSLDEASSLLFIYNAEDHEAVAAALEPLRKNKKEISMCVLVPSSGSDIAFDDSNILVYAKGGLNAWGFPSEMIVDKVAGIKSDILIDLSRPGSYALQYIALHHPCTFKVGIKYPGQEWYDLALSLTDNDDIPYSLEQILFYLRSIHTA